MLSVNIYDSLLARARRYLQSDQPRKAEAILEAVLHEVLSKICANKKIPYEREDTIRSLADTLQKAETIPEPVKNEMLTLTQRFGQATKTELNAAVEWILSFLDEYLGGQILILN